MAIAITPEITRQLEKFQKSLHTLQNVKDAFCNAPPSVDPEPYQYLLEDAVENLSEQFDALCAVSGFQN